MGGALTAGGVVPGGLLEQAIADLTTEVVAYIKALKDANVAALDVTTLFIKDRPTVIAAHAEEVDDLNTMLQDYLDD